MNWSGGDSSVPGQLRYIITAAAASDLDSFVCSRGIGGPERHTATFSNQS